MADLGGFPLEEKISQLWQSLPGDPEGDFPDDWLKAEYGDLTPDLGFLLVVSWGPQRKVRRQEIWKKVSEKFESFKTEFHRLDAKQLDSLAGCYPFGRGRNGWQGRYVRNAHRYLRVHNMSLTNLEERLKAEDPFVVRAVLVDLLETTQTKIIDCYMRDVLRIDAFPIDSRVRKMLGNFSIPPDPWAIVAVSRKLNIPVRAFARAVYAAGEPKPRKSSG